MIKKQLKILNASAGSGKTYRLVQEYIELLIADGHNSTKFASIIAMTFTNKAALEMKERIIKALDEISYPEIHQTHQLQLKKDIAINLEIAIVEVENRCRLILQNILHKYEEFHVLTIDKFNLRLIKSFSRDLDLPHDFEVIMNEKLIIEKIVDVLLNQLSANNKSDLNRILIKYAHDNLEEGAGWNFRQKLIDFGNVLTSEKNIPFVEKLTTMDLSVERHDLIRKKRNDLKNEYNAFIDAIQKACLHNDLDSLKLPGGKNTLNDLNSLLKKKDFPTVESPVGKRLSENLDKSGDALIPVDIKNAVSNLMKFWQSNLNEFVSIHLFLKNYFNMALLQYMAKALDDIKKEEQIIRISEFNLLISTLIQQEDAPFIYERLGNKFAHFLLDEFQDTSHLQWLNLIPLLHESLSNTNTNLIVGDPKQSIYRFKNGVAEQFIALPGIYNPTNDPVLERKSRYFNEMGYVESLNDNWRSSPIIVDFNNRFFEQFKLSVSETAQKFYATVTQTPKSNKKGRINILSKRVETVPDLIPIIDEQIQACLADGFQHHEICILGPTNKLCNQWAIELSDKGYKVVSSDSLLIQSDLQVQLSIAYLKWRFRPSGENEKRQFAELFFRCNEMPFEKYNSYLISKENKNGKLIRLFDDNAFLNDFFGSRLAFFFRYENLYFLIQDFIKIAKLNELKNPFLHHLADVMFNYGVQNGPDLKGFLNEYAVKKDVLAVQIPESSDAIQIMTLHKSKGLEFPVVIIPSVDFKISTSKQYFSQVDDKIIYKPLSKHDILAPLMDLYQSETNQIFIDALNLCYVGMTRPVHRLYISNYHVKDKFGAHFHTVLERMKDAMPFEDGLCVNNLNDEIQKDAIDEEKDQLFHPTKISENLWFPDIALQDKTALNSPDFLSPEMQIGLQFHALISKIDTESEVPLMIQELEKSDEISTKNKLVLAEKLRNLFQLQEYNRLIENNIEILNEQAIIVDKTTTLRPDKIIIKKDETIIIDFKTGDYKKKDEKQISNYKTILEQMGYPNVLTFIYYSAKHELKQVV